MKLESISKYFFAKTTSISDSPRATASDSLTGTDIMAALGLADLKSGYGLDLFLAKQGISKPDKAVESLYQFAMKQAYQYKAVAQLDGDIKHGVLQMLATFAYQDYSRSAASVRQCDCCQGEGFTDAEVFTMKSAFGVVRPEEFTGALRLSSQLPCNVAIQKREAVRLICKPCCGKGAISNACRCHGKGLVIDKEQTEKQGVPVQKECPKCSGRGYARLPAENVRRAICSEVMELSEPTWRRNFKPLYEELITRCHVEESEAELMLSKVTM
ncbi:antitermination protein [Ewingella americana]